MLLSRASVIGLTLLICTMSVHGQQHAVHNNTPTTNTLQHNLAPGIDVTIKPRSMAGIRPGASITIGDETTIVKRVGSNDFTADIKTAHNADDPVVIATVPVTPCSITPGVPSPRGLITVGCPKVWRSDRVFTILDGILRDVDSFTIAALLQLDPNSANAADIQSIISDFRVSVKYDQAAAINNSLKLEQIHAQRSAELDNLKQKQDANKALLDRRTTLLQQSVELQKQELDLIKAGKTDPTTSPELKALQDQQAATQDQLKQIDQQISVGTLTEQKLDSTSTTVADAKPADALKSLPDDLKKTLNELLKNPTLPASMRMDNVIELLHQRLGREFAVMYDDLSRQTENYELYLVQFDIGVVPRHDAKDREARIALHFDTPGVIAYELYPGASSYNTVRAMDKTNRLALSGLVQTIFGFGAAVGYNREHNELRSGLSQSLYVSGYGAGSPDFGWLIGPAPFENFVNPGTRSVQALVLAPKATAEDEPRTLVMHVDYCWPKRETRYQFFWESHDEGCAGGDTATLTVPLPLKPYLTIQTVSYAPHTLTTAEQSGDATQVQNTILLTFKEQIDPNLTITAGNRIIRRVRDVRGRAVYGGDTLSLLGTTGEKTALSTSRFGLLERDSLEPDTWLQVNSHAILLNISLATAGTDVFPAIRLSDPGSGGFELTQLVRHAISRHENSLRLHIGELELCNQFSRCENLVDQSFLPLFTTDYDQGNIKAYVDSITAGNVASIRIVSRTLRPDRVGYVKLHEHAQVVLEETGANVRRWPLDCDEDDGTLTCPIPSHLALTEDRYSVWVDQPPYLGLAGIWGKGTISRSGATWALSPYAFGDWADVDTVCSLPVGCGTHAWNAWRTSIQLRNTASALNTAPIDALVLHINHTLAQLMATTAKAKREYQSSAQRFTTQCNPSTFSNVTSGRLTVTIPFVCFAAIPEHLQLVDGVELPSLRHKLLPGSLQLFALGDGTYRLEGPGLNAFDQVRLDGQKVPTSIPTTAGYNSLDFHATLQPGTYNVFIVIAGGSTSVAAKRTSANGDLQQIALVIPEQKKPEEANGTTKPPTKPATKQEAKPAVKQESTPVVKKDEKAAVKQEEKAATTKDNTNKTTTHDEKTTSQQEGTAPKRTQ